MAKNALIKTFTHWAPNVAGNREKGTFRVYYDSKTDKFYMTAPDHLAEVKPAGYRERVGDGEVREVRTSDGRIWGTTPKEVEDKFIGAGYSYEKAIIKRRKVIVYCLKFATHDQWGQREDGGLTFEKGSGLIVDWGIGYEIKIGDKADILRFDPTETDGVICNNYSVGDSSYTVIDWTQQREDFFRSMTTGLETMVARAREFLGDGQKLALAIDQGRTGFLLGHESSDKKK